MPKHLRHSSLLRYARVLGFGDIHFKMDPTTGLRSIIAVHSTQRGPAIGGCRFYEYTSEDYALKDVLRLAYMMTLKAAVCDLNHGGAKAVIIKPKIIKDRKLLFQSFGDFVHELNGRYITAMDVGTSTHDMDVIAERTPHVIGQTHQGDPSPYTAKGIFRCIQAAAKFKLNRDNLDGLHIALQGAGKVATYLAELLHQEGAKISACDINIDAIENLKTKYQANIIPIEKIYDIDCDIFAPCALGGTINHETIERIKAPIIAGAANNQLAHRKYATLLHQKKVLYAPDYVINAGGLIQAASLHDYNDLDLANKLIDELHDRILTIFERSAKMNISTHDAAELIAKEKLQ